MKKCPFFIVRNYLLINNYIIMGHILHKRSSAVIDGQPKLPTPEQLEFGEIAINFSKGHETFSILNTQSGITTFSSDEVRDAKLSAHTGNSSIHLPEVTSGDNGSTLVVVNGEWALQQAVQVYYGNSTPSDSEGADGDLYITPEAQE